MHPAATATISKCTTPTTFWSISGFALPLGFLFWKLLPPPCAVLLEIDCIEGGLIFWSPHCFLLLDSKAGLITLLAFTCLCRASFKSCAHRKLGAGDWRASSHCACVGSPNVKLLCVPLGPAYSSLNQKELKVGSMNRFCIVFLERYDPFWPRTSVRSGLAVLEVRPLL